MTNNKLVTNNKTDLCFIISRLYQIHREFRGHSHHGFQNQLAMEVVNDFTELAALCVKLVTLFAMV